MASQRLLDEVQAVMRRLHYALSTERAYCDWIKRYVRFHRLQSKEQLLAIGSREENKQGQTKKQTGTDHVFSRKT